MNNIVKSNRWNEMLNKEIELAGDREIQISMSFPLFKMLDDAGHIDKLNYKRELITIRPGNEYSYTIMPLNKGIDKNL